MGVGGHIITSTEGDSFSGEVGRGMGGLGFLWGDWLDLLRVMMAGQDHCGVWVTSYPWSFGGPGSCRNAGWGHQHLREEIGAGAVRAVGRAEEEGAGRRLCALLLLPLPRRF